MHARVLCLIVLSLMLLPASRAAAQGAAITGLSLDEGTEGTILDLLGSGFGSKKPKVFLSTFDGEKVAKTKVKVLSVAAGGGTLTVQIKKALLGEYAFRVDVKGDEPAVSEDTFTIVAPELLSVDPSEAAVKDEITLVVAQSGLKKGKVFLGGRAAKVVSQTAGESPGPASTVVARLPAALATGTWEVTFVNTVGRDVRHQVVSVSGAKKEVLPKARLSAMVDDRLFESKGKAMDATLDGGVLTISGLDALDGLIGSLRLGLPDTVADDELPASYSAAPAALTLVTLEGLSTDTVWTADDDAFTIWVNARVGTLVAGSFEGTLTRTSGDGEPATREVEGTFVGTLADG